ncbi:MAG: hypothetical protein HPY64_07140 [Anaerolineae bacterium]|nr:hypothetical protein [Anaerolineae bacterium]
MSSSRFRLILAGILALYLVLALSYSALVPLFESPDELTHYALVRHLALNGLRLPVQQVIDPGPWAQEGNQPPLYYFLAALGTLRIDAATPPESQLNPHADIGVVPADGNINRMIHDPALEAFPWRGTALAVHVARLLSVLMGTVTVLTTALIAREVFPRWPQVALAAAAFNAVLPMFAFISGSVNNDNLANMLAGLLTWQIIRLGRGDTAPSWRVYAGVGVLAGAALLAKLSLGLLVALVALALLRLSVLRRDWRPLVVGGAISGAVALALAGWWYARNLQLYGDPTGLRIFLQLIGQRPVPADLWQLWSERESLLRSWWGVYGWMNVLLPDGIYVLLNLLGAAGVIGFAALGFARLAGLAQQECRPERWPMTVAVIWPLLAFGALLRWTSITPASQARLLFIAIGPLCLWLAAGLGWWLPRRARTFAWGAAAILLAGVALYGLWFIVRPAYALPALDRPLAAELPGEAVDFYEPGNEAPALRLRGYRLETTAAQPGGALSLMLYWEVLQTPTRRWSLFAHAVDSAGLIAGQRDRYPGGGTLATDWLRPGQQWVEPLTIVLPDTAYAPDTLVVLIGLYDLASGERMLIAEHDGETALLLTPPVHLQPRLDETGLPNPRYDNFGHLIALRGYDLSGRRLHPGETLTVTLYWQALARMAEDYTVFVHVIDLATWTIYGSSDAAPANWTRPTSSWEAGEIVIDAHTLTVNPETPPGVYTVEIGLYRMPQPGTFERLNVVAAPGGQASDVIYLARVAVDAAEGGTP